MALGRLPHDDRDRDADRQGRQQGRHDRVAPLVAHASVRGFELPHLLQAGKTIVAIKGFDECPHDHIPIGLMTGA